MLFITFWLGVAAHRDRMAGWAFGPARIGCKIWNRLAAPLPDYHTFLSLLITGPLMIGLLRTGKVRTSQVRRVQVRTGRVRTGRVRTGQVMTGQVRTSQVLTGPNFFWITTFLDPTLFLDLKSFCTQIAPENGVWLWRWPNFFFFTFPQISFIAPNLPSYSIINF